MNNLESKLMADVFDRLMSEIHERVRTLPEGSYTTKLAKGGIPAIAAKIREESEELIDAAEKDDRQHFVYEACDLIYHTWVLLGLKNVSVDELRKELERREGTSGIAEKNSRAK
jgi:phosphoribosyl-ATP pyrophosphohydrolase